MDEELSAAIADMLNASKKTMEAVASIGSGISALTSAIQGMKQQPQQSIVIPGGDQARAFAEAVAAALKDIVINVPAPQVTLLPNEKEEKTLVVNFARDDLGRMTSPITIKTS